ncbi:DinB family protein [Humibacter ginsengisoli]
MGDPEQVPIYPDLDADERTTLTQFLDLYRRRVIARFSALSDRESGAASLPATRLTPGGVVKHLAHMEDHWFTVRIGAGELPEPWASAPFTSQPDWDFESAVEDTVEQLTALYQAACDRSRAVVASIPDLDTRASHPSFGRGPVTLRWALVHMLEETACHEGHLELLTDPFADHLGHA